MSFFQTLGGKAVGKEKETGSLADFLAKSREEKVERGEGPAGSSGED